MNVIKIQRILSFIRILFTFYYLNQSIECIAQDVEVDGYAIAVILLSFSIYSGNHYLITTEHRCIHSITNYQFS